MGFVGCGAIARFHLDGIKEKAPDIRITAAIDPDRAKAESIAAETGAEVFASLDEALESGDFDAVDLMLPHDLHEEYALKSFDAGKHVLLEKPMAPTVDACERILDGARRADIVFMVAENSQYWPEIVTARDLIQEGKIGDILTARAAFVMEFDDYWFKDKKPWRYEKDRTGGGIIIDGGSHWLRPMRMWLGEIDEVVAALDYPLERMEGESLARALLRFQSGKVALFDAAMIETVLGPEPWWRITGTKGEILVDGGFGGLGGVRLFDADHREGIRVQEAQGYEKSFGPELLDFSLAVLSGKELEAGPEVALGELRTALAMYRSAETKRWEKVWD